MKKHPQESVAPRSRSWRTGRPSRKAEVVELSPRLPQEPVAKPAVRSADQSQVAEDAWSWSFQARAGARGQPTAQVAAGWERLARPPVVQRVAGSKARVRPGLSGRTCGGAWSFWWRPGSGSGRWPWRLPWRWPGGSLAGVWAGAGPGSCRGARRLAPGLAVAQARRVTGPRVCARLERARDCAAVAPTHLEAWPRFRARWARDGQTPKRVTSFHSRPGKVVATSSCRRRGDHAWRASAAQCTSGDRLGVFPARVRRAVPPSPTQNPHLTPVPGRRHPAANPGGLTTAVVPGCSRPPPNSSKKSSGATCAATPKGQRHPASGSDSVTVAAAAGRGGSG